jgi:hypothetical protein
MPVASTTACHLRRSAAMKAEKSFAEPVPRVAPIVVIVFCISGDASS